MPRLFFAILAIVFAGVVFVWYTKPSYDSAKMIQAQIAQYNTALDKASELQKLKQTLLSRYNAFNPTDLDRLHKLLPDHVDNVRLILDLDNLAGRYGLSLQNVDVSSSASQSSKNQTTVGAIGASNQKYDSLTLTFGTRATYQNFLLFLKDLEASLRIVDLVSLTISPDPFGAVGTLSSGKASTVSEPQYSYKITLRTYWQNNNMFQTLSHHKLIFIESPFSLLAVSGMDCLHRLPLIWSQNRSLPPEVQLNRVSSQRF